jgi:hypothetical protein
MEMRIEVHVGTTLVLLALGRCYSETVTKHTRGAVSAPKRGHGHEFLRGSQERRP